jgi:hypothetical protein
VAGPTCAPPWPDVARGLGAPPAVSPVYFGPRDPFAARRGRGESDVVASRGAVDPPGQPLGGRLLSLRSMVRWLSRAFALLFVDHTVPLVHRLPCAN